jgi:hypothetical protein
MVSNELYLFAVEPSCDICFSNFKFKNLFLQLIANNVF